MFGRRGPVPRRPNIFRQAEPHDALASWGCLFRIENFLIAPSMSAAGLFDALRQGGEVPEPLAAGCVRKTLTNDCSIKFRQLEAENGQIHRKKVLAFYGWLRYTEKRGGGKWSESAIIRREMEGEG